MEDYTSNLHEAYLICEDIELYLAIQDDAFDSIQTIPYSPNLEFSFSGAKEKIKIIAKKFYKVFRQYCGAFLSFLKKAVLKLINKIPVFNTSKNDVGHTKVPCIVFNGTKFMVEDIPLDKSASSRISSIIREIASNIKNFITRHIGYIKSFLSKQKIFSEKGRIYSTGRVVDNISYLELDEENKKKERMGETDLTDIRKELDVMANFKSENIVGEDLLESKVILGDCAESLYDIRKKYITAKVNIYIIKY